jgi:hypothetical protein
MVAAAMSRLGGCHGHPHLRARQAVPTKQRRHNQRRHENVGRPPHSDSHGTIIRWCSTSIFQSKDDPEIGFRFQYKMILET